MVGEYRLLETSVKLLYGVMKKLVAHMYMIVSNMGIGLRKGSLIDLPKRIDLGQPVCLNLSQNFLHLVI